MLKLSKRTRNRLESNATKYPDLYKFAINFIDSDGNTENGEFLPKLLQWIREATDDDPSEFNLDNDTLDEFYSWGTILAGKIYFGIIRLTILIM